MSHHGDIPSEFLDDIRQRFGQIGATGQFPRGRLGPTDEGEIKIAIAADPSAGIIRIEFGKPIAWIGFTPEQAREIADSLTAKAFECRGITS